MGSRITRRLRLAVAGPIASGCAAADARRRHHAALVRGGVLATGGAGGRGHKLQWNLGRGAQSPRGSSQECLARPVSQAPRRTFFRGTLEWSALRPRLSWEGHDRPSRVVKAIHASVLLKSCNRRACDRATSATGRGPLPVFQLQTPGAVYCYSSTVNGRRMMASASVLNFS